MNKKQKDRHFDVPAEANRDKHINFVAEERKEIDPAREASTGPFADSTNQRINDKTSKRKGNYLHNGRRGNH